MITREDLRLQFLSDTGHKIDNFPEEFADWVEEKLLKYMNEEKDLRDWIGKIEIPELTEEEIREFEREFSSYENRFKPEYLNEPIDEQGIHRY